MAGFCLLFGIDSLIDQYSSIPLSGTIVLILLGCLLFLGAMFFLSAIFQKIEIDLLNKRVKRFRPIFPMKTANLDEVTGISWRVLMHKSIFLGYLVLITTKKKNIPVLITRTIEHRNALIKLLEAIIVYAREGHII